MTTTIERLQLTKLSRAFGATQALADFDLDVAGGAFITLLGPSGCGKTTALNCIAGLLPLSGGEIRINGERIDQMPAEKRGFGMVFQNYALFPHLSVARNVAFGLELRGVAKAERQRRVDEALALMQLSGLSHRLPAELSGGQQQRLAFARAVVLEPRLLLLDEPLSNLDAKLREELRLGIRQLHDRLGLTTIHVSHDQTEAMSLSDLVVVMRAGRIEQAGTPQEIFETPASLYVADFMGYRNRLAVTVSDADARTLRLEAPGVQLVAPNHAGLRRGQAAVACFRPSDAALLPEGSDGLHVTAHLRSLEYLGQRYGAEAQLASGEDVLFPVNAPLPLGSACRLGIAMHRLMVYPRPDGGPAGTTGAAEARA